MVMEKFRRQCSLAHAAGLMFTGLLGVHKLKWSCLA
eukprot:SAG11_NODE_33591_length_276_cov_0.881356_1_plen_35_part_10